MNQAALKNMSDPPQTEARINGQAFLFVPFGFRFLAGSVDHADKESLWYTKKQFQKTILSERIMEALFFNLEANFLRESRTGVFIFGRRNPDGSVSATRATLEKDGVKPPM
jgi:hypothetical protein